MGRLHLVTMKTEEGVNASGVLVVTQADTWRK